MCLLARIDRLELVEAGFQELLMAAFDRWLSTQMERRKIWSINRVAREAGLNAEHVGDWMLGRALPSALEAAKLAEYLGLSFRDVAEATGLRDLGEHRGKLA